MKHTSHRKRPFAARLSGSSWAGLLGELLPLTVASSRRIRSYRKSTCLEKTNMRRHTYTLSVEQAMEQLRPKGQVSHAGSAIIGLSSHMHTKTHADSIPLARIITSQLCVPEFMIFFEGHALLAISMPFGAATIFLPRQCQGGSHRVSAIRQ